MPRWRLLVAEMGGAGTAALYVLHRLLQRVSGGRMRIIQYRIVAQPVGNPALRSIRPAADTVVRLVDRSDPVTAQFPRPATVVQGRFANGDQCYVVSVKGEFAGHIWIARSRYTEDEVRGVYVLSRPSETVWDYDVYVAPAHRGTRTLARMWKYVDESLASEQQRWSFSRISRFNSESLRSHARLGAVALGWITVLRIGSIQLHLTGGSNLLRSTGANSWHSFAVDVAPPSTPQPANPGFAASSEP
jgi:hypothetical protein